VIDIQLKGLFKLLFGLWAVALAHIRQGEEIVGAGEVYVMGLVKARPL